MARKFNELVEQMPPDARTRAEAQARKLIAEYALEELRRARSMTQARLPRKFWARISLVISRTERRTDMYVSTLAEFIRRLWGGELEIRAVFPEELRQDQEIRRYRSVMVGPRGQSTEAISAATASRIGLIRVFSCHFSGTVNDPTCPVAESRTMIVIFTAPDISGTDSGHATPWAS